MAGGAPLYTQVEGPAIPAGNTTSGEQANNRDANNRDANNRDANNRDGFSTAFPQGMTSLQSISLLRVRAPLGYLCP